MKYILVVLKIICCFSVFAATPGAYSLELMKHPESPAALLESGISYLKKGNADKAELLLTEAAQTAIRKKDIPVFIKAQMNIGRIYADKGENVKALSHFQQGLTKAESTGNKQLTAHLYKNIGALYISWKKFGRAISYYEKAENIAAEIHEDELVADCQNNKGTVYEQQQEYNKAISAYKNALTVYTQKNITDKISMALSNIAIVYKYQKNYQASLEYNLKALTLSTKLGDKWLMAATNNNIGSLYCEMADYKKAIAYCEKALALAKEISALEIIESTYDTMSEIAAKAGDYKAAFNYHKRFSDANAKFINIESTRQLSELNIKYETAKKQKLIQQQQFEISKQNYLLFSLFILILLGATVAYLIYRTNKYKLEKRLQAEVYRQQELASRALFEGEQKERIRIARDLHDSIGQMLAVLKMKLSNQQSPADTIEVLDKTITEVRHISHNLIPEALNFGLINAIEDLAGKINATGKTRVEVAISDEVRNYTFTEQNALSVYRIVQEVLGNISKHADATEIDLDITKAHDTFTITIKDNGKGFDTSKIKESKGLGWKNISARVHLLNGSMQVTSEKLTGTQIKITIPT
ncbi:tetratricopeptide repeat protein (plasmid) [Pedobacter sp. BS3]|uniref:tetratricopeptide repeat protein n=1 Tax=Pedobacter sp. BS3 TaxID=2567937 RepID=UPI0011EBEA4E|nr:tetratricopeptide repeat protein [Pedobacter sp. BS3]TZF86132.1 tetratricopeptide repeat protein [Pedobacter sp. BS3]